jgi:hypothetical protein
LFRLSNNLLQNSYQAYLGIAREKFNVSYRIKPIHILPKTDNHCNKKSPAEPREAQQVLYSRFDYLFFSPLSVLIVSLICSGRSAHRSFISSKSESILDGFCVCIETAFSSLVLSRDMPQKTPDLLESAETGAETIFRLSVSFVPCFI